VHIAQLSVAKDVILDICRVENSDTAGVFAVLLWEIWNNRNKCLE
ncbi:hypothetical protein L195_g029000, partial [Trifolium pratense]